MCIFKLLMDADPQLRVRHVRFGHGAVLHCKGKRVRVAFEDPQKRRTVHAAYLQKVA